MAHTDTSSTTPATAHSAWRQRLHGWRDRAYAASRQLLDHLRNRLWPTVRQHSHTGARYVRHRVMPVTAQAARHTAVTAVNLYERHAWLQRCGTAMYKKAVGLAVAMAAAKMVANMVETRKFSNLWGLAADKPLVSDTTYSVLLFLVEYSVALIVFAVIDRYIAELRRRRAVQPPP